MSRTGAGERASWTDHDIQLLLLDLALIIALARLLGAAASASASPPVVGEIIAGILLRADPLPRRHHVRAVPGTLRCR